ncbi:MAG: hypothetical protein COB03_02970 [Alteromonas sp.]|nr:MAG: hypothetical protein COB03_02970 [Alteromonas sp.]
MNRLLFSIICLGFISACSQPSSEERLNEVQKIYAKEDYSTSIIDLKDIVQSNPNYIPARLLLADAYLKIQQPLNAKRELTRILKMGDSLSEKQILTASENYLLLSFMNQEVDDIASFIEDFPDLSSPEILSLHQQFSSFLNADSFSLDSLLNVDARLASALAKLHRSIANAGNELEKETASYLSTYENGRFLPMLGQYYLATENFEACKSSFSTFSLRRFQHPFINLRLSQCFYKLGDLDNAMILAKNIISKFEDQPLANKLAGTISFLNNEPKLAEPYLINALKQNPNDIQSKVYLGAIYMQRGDYERAFQRLKGVGEIYPEGHLARRILAITQIQLGDYEKGIGEFTDSQHPFSSSELSMLSMAAIAAGIENDNHGKEAILDNITSLNMDTMPGEASKIVLLSAVDKKDGLIDFDALISSIPEDNSVKRVIIGTLFRYDEADRLTILSERWKNTDPFNAKYASGLSAFLSGQYKLTVDLLKDLITQSPNDHFLLLTLVSSYQYLGNYNEAVSLLQAAIPKSKNASLLLNSLFTLNLQNDLNQDFLYNAIIQKAKTSKDYLLLKAKFEFIEGKLETSIATLKHYSNSVEATSDAYWKLFLKIKLVSGNEEEILDAYDEWSTHKPELKLPMLSKILYLESTGDLPSAIQLAREGTKRFPNEEKFKLLEANFLLMDNQFQMTSEIVKNLSNQAMESPLGRGISAALALKNKEYSQAEKMLKLAYGKVPSPRVASMLFSTFMHQKRTNEAIEFLESHIVLMPSDKQNLRLLADTLISVDLEKSKKYYELIIQTQPNNHQVLNNLSWVEFKLGNNETAKRYVENAIKIAPEIDEYKDTLDQVTTK